MFKATHTFKAQEDYDCDINRGDLITNVEYLDNGWAMGYNASRKDAGVFPRRYIQQVQEDVTSILPPRMPRERPDNMQQRVAGFYESPELQIGWQSLNFNALKEAYKKVIVERRPLATTTKAIIGLVVGLILGVLTYIGCRYALEYDWKVSLGLAGFAGISLSIGLAFSTKCRAVVSLCIPSLATRSGRTMFATLAITVLLAGPIANLSKNTGELAGTASCSAELLRNEAEKLQELLKEPYETIAQGLQTAIRELESAAAAVKDIAQPLVDFGKDLQASLANAVDAVSQAKERCQIETDLAAEDCKQKISQARTQCNDVLLIGSANCVINNKDCSKPRPIGACIQLTDALCEPVKAAGDVCAGVLIDNVLDEVQASLTAGIDKLKSYVSTNITINSLIAGSSNTSKNSTQVKADITNEINKRTALITTVIGYANKVLSLSVLLVLFSAFGYLRKYMKDDQFDNLYITDGFIVVDKARKSKGKQSLLPLTPKEKKRIVNTTQLRLSGIEKKVAFRGLLMVLLNLLGGVAIILFDYVIYEAIIITKEYGSSVKAEYSLDTNVGVDVDGEGILAEFIKRFLGGLSTKSSINRPVDFAVCLPSGSEPKYEYIIGVSLLYLLLIFLVLLQAYALRWRHSMTGFFYPEREKGRVKTLHRNLLRRRVILLKELKDVLMLRREQLEHQEIAKDWVDDLKICCGCEENLSVCAICGKYAEHECPKCSSFFCEDCHFITIREVCPCDPDQPLTYDHVTDSDFEEDVQEEIVYSYTSRAGVQAQEQQFRRQSLFLRQPSVV